MQLANSYSHWKDANEPRNTKKRRSHIEVQAEILKALASEYMTINQLAIRVNLNSLLANNYVKELANKGLIESGKTEELAKYSTTQRGIDWLKRFESLVRD